MLAIVQKPVLSAAISILVLFVSGTQLVRAQETKQDTLKELQRQVQILAAEIERLKLGEVAERRYEPAYGFGPGASRVYRLKKTGVSLAGYGEVLYENFDSSREDGSPSGENDRIDFLRNILYVGFRFNEWILFNSELEFEHSSTGKAGEVSVEFGYVDLLLSKELNVRAGMVLVPVGIVNERHEPSTFHGSRRTGIEQSIIPTTWRTNGAGIFGEIATGLDYRVYVVEGLNASKFSAGGIRGGRQSGSKAIAENFAFTGRLEYEGIAGAMIGVSFYTGNSAQGVIDSLGELSATTTLWSVHGDYAWKGLELRGQYARATIDEVDRINRINGLSGSRSIGESLEGWYVTAAYDVLSLSEIQTNHALSPFIQYQQYNTQATVPTGYTSDPVNDRSGLTAGLTYKPHPNVAFKFDYQNLKNEAETGIDQWNLAVNYLF